MDSRCETVHQLKKLRAALESNDSTQYSYETADGVFELELNDVVNLLLLHHSGELADKYDDNYVNMMEKKMEAKESFTEQYNMAETGVKR